MFNLNKSKNKRARKDLPYITSYEVLWGGLERQRLSVCWIWNGITRLKIDSLEMSKPTSQSPVLHCVEGVKAKWKGVSHHNIPTPVSLSLSLSGAYGLRASLLLSNSNSGRQRLSCLIHQVWIKSSENLENHHYTFCSALFKSLRFSPSVRVPIKNESRIPSVTNTKRIKFYS